MLSKVYSASIIGVDGAVICCEADVGKGLPNTILVGYLATQVREAADRIKTAIKNSGFSLNSMKIVINLSPANIKKEGTSYDLPIAVSLLSSYGFIDANDFSDSIFIGELSLSGDILGVSGILPMVLAARDSGFKRVYLPKENEAEALMVEGIESYGIKDLATLTSILDKSFSHPQVNKHYHKDAEYRGGDFSDISGNEYAKRATILAVAGRHNILYIGQAGCGKSMLASRIPGIMPDMDFDEAIAVSKIYSICGLLNKEQPIINFRPYRAVHHSISRTALIGGGNIPRPGEISLANKGVLFLDELCEFDVQTLDLLRQPIEEKSIIISRLKGTYTFPADFMLCAATNPCKCGYYPDRTRCRCSSSQIKKYLSRISKPILDRIDICIEMKALEYNEIINNTPSKCSKDIKLDIKEIEAIQRKRFKDYDISFNSQMQKIHMDEFCKLNLDVEKLLEKLYKKNRISIRALYKIIRVARTIADFDARKNIKKADIYEAFTYKTLNLEGLGI